MYLEAAFLWTKLTALVDAGGAVMWPLLAVGLLVWTLLVLRLFSLHDVRRALKRTLSPDALTGRQLRLKLNQHAALIDTLVTAAPLLGLLGTVSGMIATFEGLTSMSLYTEDGGVAGGISVALLTTQAGLMIAIPAFFVSRLLGRQATRLAQQVEAQQGQQEAP